MGARVVGMLAMAGAILGFFVSLVAPHRYVGSTTLRVRGTADALAARLFAVETLTLLINQESNLKEMLTVYPADELIEIVRQNSKIRARAEDVEITYEDDAAERALSIDRELAVIAAKISGSSQMIRGPHTEPTGATAPVASGIGMAMGTFVGLVTVFIAARLKY